ncbi:T9SS type A sorting domain-containing protein [Hymenobacter sp. 15J16-1T3B]|uniref:IPT/TIG domain-containing protein n=1 Tax=Hymenobacter sp. 15J16-1T3B TaxID=2886941 RepID=UPI001D108B79|nr:IPT/TIG domain-containing protein [Hymenobacter sp. 15J16-1T3B]MCC3156481.1 T9SS type A sorting domain-containing protein [Hymenobacter sp. 15J16-1T3B]
MLFALLLGQRAHGQSWLWASTSEQGLFTQTDLAVDAAGNTYMTGNFGRTHTFGNGVTVTHTGTIGYNDDFIARFSASGTPLWAVLIDQSSASQATPSVAVGANGDAWVTGRIPYGESVTIGAQTFAATTFTDSYFAKFSSNGTLQWAQKLTGYATADVAADASGNAYLNGTLSNGATLGTTTSGAGNGLAVVAKFSSSGSVVWTSYPSTYDAYTSSDGGKLALDNAGNVWVTGRVTTTSGFTGGYIMWGLSRVYAPVMSPYGTPRWYAVRMSAGAGAPDLAFEVEGPVSSPPGLGAEVGLATDNAGNIYFAHSLITASGTGYTVVVGQSYNNLGVPSGGTSIPVAVGDNRWYLAKFTSTGTLAWVKQANSASPASANAYGLTVSSAGEPYVGGYFSGTIDIDGTALTSTRDANTTQRTADGFLARFSAAGSVTSVMSLSGTDPTFNYASQDYVYGIAADGNGGVYVSGDYGYNATFGSLTMPAVNQSNSSTFLAKYGTACTPPTANAGPDKTACSGGTVTLGDTAVQAGVNYSWSVTPNIPGFSSSQARPTVTLPTVTASTQYVFTLTVTNAAASACSTTDAATVTVAPAPTAPAAAAAPASIGQGQSTTLSVTNAQSGVSYTWSGPGLQTTAGSSVTATPPSTGAAQYTVTATNASNCTATGQVSVSVTAPVPVLTNFSPAYVKPGDAITITGQNLQGLTQLTFNGAPQTSFSVNSAGTQVTTTVPGPSYRLNGTEYPVTTGLIRATTPAGTASSATRLRIFNVVGYYDPARGYNYPAPQNATLTVSGGALLSIKGSGLLNATSASFQGLLGCGSFASFAAPLTVLNDSMLTISFGSPLAGFGYPSVTSAITTSIGTLSPYSSSTTISGNPYFANLSIAQPYASCLSPRSGPVGTRVTVSGNWPLSVSPPPTSITFNGVPGLNFAVGSTGAYQTVSADVPAGLSPGTITVQVGGNTSLAASASDLSLPFTLTAQPTIASFTPGNGPTNLTSVTLTGTNLTGTTAVSFNGTAAAGFTVNANGTSLTVTVPNGATTGPITVTTPQGTATSASNFTVTGQGPLIGSFAPVFAKSGQTVTITGSNLTGATALTFGGVSQPSFTVNAAGTQITAAVPYANASASPDLPSGLIQVATPTGTATSATTLRLLAVTGVTTSWGGAGGLTGDNVTLNGTGFTGATVAYVLNSATYPVTYTVVSETQITATVPDLSGATALSGNGGFTVTNTPGLSGANFEVLSPVVSSLSPNAGPVGTVVTVTGFNFQRTDPRSGLPQATAVTGITFNGVAATNFQLLSPTQVRVTVPAGAATGYARPTGGTLQESVSRGVLFTVGQALTTWTGAVSTDWLTAGNWTAGVPSATLSASIPAGLTRYPVLNAAGSPPAAVLDLTLQTGASLALQSGQLNVYGSVVNHGTLTAGTAAVALLGPAAQTLSGSGTTTWYDLTVGPAGATLSAPAQVQRVLTLNGNLTSNGNLTLLSSAAGTALVVNNGGAVTGTATVQRYIDPALNAGPGYRHLAAPVSGSTVADLATASFSPVVNPAYNTAPVPNNVTPFPTVFGYDEQRLTAASTLSSGFDYGWVSPSSTANALTVARGYTVNLAPQTVDFTGTLNNGPLSVSLTRGGTSNSGWHLLGNPYPSPLNWDALARPAGVDNALYVYRSSGPYTGSYQAYVNGVGPAGANRIPLGQGFFVRATTAATFAFSNAARMTSPLQDAPVYRTQETRPLLALGVQQAGAPEDVLYVYQQAGATTGFDAAYDAVKVQFNGGSQPTLYHSTPTGESLAIQGLPAGPQPVDLPLAVYAPQAGSYTFTPRQLENFPAAAQLLLEDRQTGTWHDLRQGGYAAQLTTGLQPVRFVLHLYASRVTASQPAQLSAATLQVFPNPATNGRHVTVSAAGLPGTQAELCLLNGLGQVVRRETVALSGRLLEHAFPLAQLPAGVYTLQVRTQAGMLTRKLVLQ